MWDSAFFVLAAPWVIMDAFFLLHKMICSLLQQSVICIRHQFSSSCIIDMFAILFSGRRWWRWSDGPRWWTSNASCVTWGQTVLLPKYWVLRVSGSQCVMYQINLKFKCWISKIKTKAQHFEEMLRDVSKKKVWSWAQKFSWLFWTVNLNKSASPRLPFVYIWGSQRVAVWDIFAFEA